MSIQNASIVAIGVNPEEYHSNNAPRGSLEFQMSPSSLKLFAECPRRFIDGYMPPASEAKAWGSALDAFLLTPDQFETRYVVRPSHYTAGDGTLKKWNGNASVCKEWMESNAGAEVIKAEDMEALQTAKSRLFSDPIIKSLLDSSDKQVHVTGIWNDSATGLKLPVQCLIDILPRIDTEWATCAVDFKSTRNASTGAFLGFAYKMGYHIQAGMDLDLLTKATGEDRNTWLLVLQESFPPWQPGRRMLSQRFTDMGRRRYKALLAAYAQCLKSGQWPDYDDNPEAIQGWTLMEPAAYMEMDDWKFAMSQMEQPEAEVDETSEMPS